MSRFHEPTRLARIALALGALTTSCSSGEATEPGTSGGGGQAGSGGTGGAAVEPALGGAGSGSSSGGTEASDAGVSGDAGAEAGAPGAMRAPPGPTEDGLAVYTVECAGESQVCGYPEAHCLGIYLDDGSVGFACSNLCESVENCSDAPSGAEAEVACVAFTAARRCVLVCRSGDIERDCPSGMSCYSYPNSGIGYCLYL